MIQIDIKKKKTKMILNKKDGITSNDDILNQKDSNTPNDDILSQKAIITKYSCNDLSHNSNDDPPSQKPIITELKMICSILKNCMMGGITITIALSFFVAETIMLSHLQSSSLFVTAKINSNGFISVLLSTVLWFNNGLLICVSRCIATHDYKGIKQFLKMHF